MSSSNNPVQPASSRPQPSPSGGGRQGSDQTDMERAARDRVDALLAEDNRGSPGTTTGGMLGSPAGIAALWTPAVRRHAMLILGIAAALRLVWALVIPVVPVSDAIPYDRYARTVAQGLGYGMTPDTLGAFWPPGTSFLMAGVYKLTGATLPPADAPVYQPLAGGYGAIEVMNLLMGVGVVVFTMGIAVRLLGVRAALLAGWLMALWPMGITFTSILQSEIPCTFFMLGGLWAFLEFKQKTALRVLLCGVAFAFAAYVRPTVLLVPPILFGIEFLLERGRVRTFLTAPATGLLMAAIIAPWSIRNTRLFGEFVAISTNSGTNFWMGNNPKSTGFYMDFERDPALNELQNDRKFKQEALAYIKQEPAAFVKRTLIKLVRLHERQTIGTVWNVGGLKQRGLEKLELPLKAGSTGYWLLLAIGGVVGTVMLALRKGLLHAATSPLVIIWAYFAVLYAVYVIQDRYTFPFTPLVACLATLPLGVIVSRLPRVKQWFAC